MIRRWAPKNLAIIGAALLAVTGAAAWAALEIGAAPADTEAVDDMPRSRAGYRVFLDDKGNRIAPPHDHVGEMPSIKDMAESAPVTKTLMEGGGYKVDLSHMRVYQKATIDESGKVSTECVTSDESVKH